MGDNKSTTRIILEAVFGIAVLVWSFMILNEGFYMDESGMLTIYRGIYQGNRMFIDAWGAHQMGWFMTWPFFALYDLLESTLYPMGIGLVLFMRICYQVCRFFIAIYLYITIRRTDYKNSAFIVAITYYMFFENFKNFSYKSMCDFAVMLFIIWACRFFQTKNRVYYFLMAVATCVAILAYPSMIIFPFIFVITQFVMMYKGYELLKPTILYCITCFVIGIAVVLYIQFTSGLANVLPQLAYTEDAAYKHPIHIRLGIMLLSYLFFAVVAYLPIVVIKIVSHFRYIAERTVGIVLSIYWFAFMAAVIGLKADSASTTRFIYGLLVIFFWFPYLIKEERSNATTIGRYKLPDYSVKHMGVFIFFTSVVVQLIWAVTTNQEVTVPGHMCIYVVLAVLMLAEDEESGLQVLRGTVVALSVFFMGFWIAESDGGYNDVMEHRIIVEEGGYRGMALDETDYQMNQSCHKLISEHITPEDKLYIVNAFGTTGYLDTDAKQAAGSPFSRVGAGQLRVLEFWQVNPESQADYVLIDKANKYYENYTQGETAVYINENYPNVIAEDGNVVLLGR